MTTAEAIELIRPAVDTAPGALWVDLGAGSGTFTRALATLLPADATVIAVDRDPNALRQLRRLAASADGASIEVVAGDVKELAMIPALAAKHADGVLLANVLHFVPEPPVVLMQVRKILAPHARVVIVEYDRRSASRWVPHPLPAAALAAVARAAGLSEPVEIGRRESRYQGELYCAEIRSRD